MEAENEMTQPHPKEHEGPPEAGGKEIRPLELSEGAQPRTALVVGPAPPAQREKPLAGETRQLVVVWRGACHGTRVAAPHGSLHSPWPPVWAQEKATSRPGSPASPEFTTGESH